MDYKDYMEQRRIKVENRERCRWRNDTITWANSTAEILDSSRYTVRKLRNQIKAAAYHYAETGSSEDLEKARFLILQMVDMFEEASDERT